MDLVIYMALLLMSILSISSHPFAAACYPPDLAALRTFARSFPSADFSDWELALDDCCAWGLSINCSSTSSATHNGSSWRRVTSLTLDAQRRFSAALSASAGGRSFNPNTFPLCTLSALSFLQLRGGWLTGPIPLCIGTNLTYLLHLDLSSNALTGPIPPSFSLLQSLQLLYLDHNSLSGPLPSFLSDGRLPNLTVLSLSLNSLSRSLPAFTAPNLIYISLDSNFFSGSIPAFNNCPHLALLILSRNSFSGSISHALFPATLSTLDLSSNSLSGAMPDLSLLPSLQSLHLSNNLLDGIIPESICGLAELQELDLSSNAFSGQLFASGGAVDLCGQPKFLNLSSLYLSHNKLVGPFPSRLGYFSNLQFIDLSYNRFTGSIPSSWQNLSSLMELKLSGNTLVSASPSAPSLPPWLFQLPSLSKMELSSVGIHAENLGCSSPHLPLFNTSLPYQGDLDISYNNISADVLRCFTLLSTLNLSGNPLALNLNNPKEVKLLPQITYILDLSSCNLTGRVTDLFLDRLMPLRITELHLANNQLGGHIAAQLSNLSSLWFLDLAHNSFTSFEAGGVHLGALLYIDLSYNVFTGSLSSLLVDLTNRTNLEEVICVTMLRDLDLSHNLLTGHIPPSVGHCIDTRIKLNNNKLEGHIPRYFFGNITDNGVEILSLSSNQLRGEIPYSMRNLKHLKLLDLGHNELEGNLETTLFTNASDQFRALRVLVLGYNCFTGTIPVSLGKFMPALQVIDMSNNQISGFIPESLRDLPAFRILERSQSSLPPQHGTLFEEIRITIKGTNLDFQYVLRLLTSIDLSRNNLSGPIPTGLGTLLGLFYLNFSSNKLSGTIPPDLGMLGEQLQSLDLSVNELVGSIPKSFNSLTKLAVFNVSYNKGLCGSIPSSPQFVTADSYIGDPDLCGKPILRPCTIIDNCPSAQKGTTMHKSGRQRSSFARWMDEWIGIPGLCLGILVGFVMTLWSLYCLRKNLWH